MSNSLASTKSIPFLGIVVLFLWIISSGGDGQAGYFTAPLLKQERLARQRHAFGVLNSTAWGDFQPRLATDPVDDPETAARYLNMTGFREADGFAWEDLGRFKTQCADLSRRLSPSLPDRSAIDAAQVGVEKVDKGGKEVNAWGEQVVGAVWQNATGIVKGSWIRRPASVSRSWTNYNFTAMTPSISWIGTFGEWNRNLTASEGKMELRVEEEERYIPYDKVVDAGQGSSNIAGGVREVTVTMTVEDSGADGSGSGSTYEMRLHGVHWPNQGNMLVTTTSEKFAGIFGLPHLASDENGFRSSQRLLNQTLLEALKEKERSAFVDQGNPWTANVAGTEDGWNPSPHCEYVVYLQIHPLGQDGSPSMVDQRLSADAVRGAVKMIEDELRNPTGAPIQQVPELQMSAIVYSPDCAFFLESKGPPEFPAVQGYRHLVGFKEEVWMYDVNFWVLALAAIAFGQLYLLKSQMRESYTPSTMGRVSFWTLLGMVLADGIMCALSAALALESSNFYLHALILTFALFMSTVIGGSFLSEIYRIQEPEWRPRERERAANTSTTTNTNSTPPQQSTPAPPRAEAEAETLPQPVTASTGVAPAELPIIIPSDQDIDAEIIENLTTGAAAVPNAGTTGTQQPGVVPFSTIVARLILLGSIISFLSLAARSWWKPVRNSFINTTLLIYLSLWIPQIFRNIQRNSRRAFSWPFMIGQSVLRILPISYFYLHPRNLIFSEPDWTAFAVLAGWLWSQLWILYYQDVLGPRFGLPKGWLPEAWDYHPVLCEDNLETGRLPIGLAPPSSPTASPTTDKGSNPTQLRSIDCVICCETLEVPVVKAGMEADPGGVAGLLERRKYMVTPCRHIFHSACLEGWLRYRLQCPICREELPPL
ncbi:hypothetical protein BD289DRAFT_459352 [Coniella lustricola]|uniref:DSC E3 ubiquitin ligase complex subunit A n=1 Tax=Coniella lustricola TaxID=2025994 RepID=A0A2T3AEW8_9PEZI|nr:hypothetical protein BD289DRAFT_459352 [Coniella lustricola]